MCIRDSYWQWGHWDGSTLDYAFPKHGVWKSGVTGYSMATHNHHIWSQYLMGASVATVPVRERLHQGTLHTTGWEPRVRANLGVGRSLADVHARYIQERAAGTHLDFIENIRDELEDLYDDFQAAHVVSGDFNA